jgi:hypothetical protein
MISSDKSLLVNITGELQGYPVYGSLGNIHSSVRSKYQAQAWVLLGYLPLPKWITRNQKVISVLEHRLYHHCMSIIVRPLVALSHAPKPWSDPSGHLRLVVPVLMSMPLDHPEQLRVAGVRKSTSPISVATTAEFGSAEAAQLRRGSRTVQTLSDLAMRCDPDDKLLAFDTLCKDQKLIAVVDLFWKDWWAADPCEFLTLDDLHALDKFFYDHPLHWIKNMVDSLDELDFRHRIQQLRVGTRHFRNGVTKLRQCTGREHRELERILITASRGVAGISKRATTALRAINDVIFLCRYRSHDDATIDLLVDALARFHQHKDALIECGGRLLDHFNLPKLEKMHHIAHNIRQLGTIGQYSTQATEHEHKESCGRPFAASNHKDYLKQMVRYRDRQEKVQIAPDYVLWKMHSEREDDPGDPDDNDDEDDFDQNDLGNDYLQDMVYQPPIRDFFAGGTDIKRRRYVYGDVAIWLSPQRPRPMYQPIASVILDHRTSSFVAAFFAFEKRVESTNLSHKATRQPSDYQLPFDSVTVWPSLRLQRRAIHDPKLLVEPVTVKAAPVSNKEPYGNCNMVLICTKDTDTVGLKGMNRLKCTSGTRLMETDIMYGTGYEVAQLRLIFEPLYRSGLRSEMPLVYIEYFRRSGFDKALDMHKFRRSLNDRQERRVAIMPLEVITKAVQLVPWFGEDEEAPRNLNCHNVMEEWDEYLLNSFSDDFTYQTVY